MPARLDHVAPFGHHLGDHADPRAVLLDPPAVRGSDQPALQGVAVDPGDLRHLIGHGTGVFVHLAEPSDLVRGGDRTGWPLRSVAALPLHPHEVDHGSRRPLAQGRARGGGGFQQRVAIEPVGEGVAVRRAFDDADPRATVKARREFLDFPVVEPDRGR